MTHRPLGGPPRTPATPGRPHPADPGGSWERPPDSGGVDPAVLAALLCRHGWRRHGSAAGRYARWTPPGPGSRTSLLVPLSRAFPDSDDLLEEALTALGRSEAPWAREVLIALTVPSDEIRWWRDTPAAPAGAASWPDEERLRACAHRMLLAGALAAHARAAYHGNRHRAAATAALDTVLVGAAPGARQLTAFLPADTDRALAIRLHQALGAVRDAIDYQRATGGMDAFDTAVGAGVSHELTEALIALVRGSQGARITLQWAPAAGPPHGCGPEPEPVEFSPGDLPALREASARYLSTEPPLPVSITGSVVRMRRSGPRGQGTVRLRILDGADVAHVRLTLDEEAYRIAGQAHLVGLPIRVHGMLESRGGFRRLSGARGVAPVEVDETERDRLLKSLQDNVDFFEGACGGE